MNVTAFWDATLYSEIDVIFLTNTQALPLAGRDVFQ